MIIVPLNYYLGIAAGLGTSGVFLFVPSCALRGADRAPHLANLMSEAERIRLALDVGPGPRPSNSHCTGTSAGAPLFFIKSTRNFAGLVLLAFRSTR